MDRNLWILLCFLTFVAFLFLFAAVYYRLYLRSSNYFFFSSEIQTSQHHAFLARLAERIRTVESCLEAIRAVRVEFGGGASIEDHVGRSGPLPSGGTYRVVRGAVGGPGGGGIFYGINVYGASGGLVSYIPLPESWPWSRGGWQGRAADAALLDHEARLRALETRRQAASEQPVRVWSFWDFLYFSTITQTTVGYGDILPNATSVRLLVVLQVLIGYAILVILLNVVFGHAAA